MSAPNNATGLYPSANFGDSPKICAGAPGKVFISRQDREILRELAAGVRRLAERPEENHKRELWYAHNSLQPGRPLLLVDPENGWNEIVTGDSLRCAGELARRWELVLRREIFTGEKARDDKPIEALFEVGHTFSESDVGVQETYHGGVSGQSYVWDAALKGPEDVERLHFPELRVDYRTTLETLALAAEVFGDLLRVRLRGVWWWSFGMTWDLAKLVGLEKLMLLMYDDPALIHRLMTFLRDASLAKLDFLERENLLSLNNDHSYVGSGGLGYTRELPKGDSSTAPVTARDMWGFTESQETVGISPDMFEEFVFQYQEPIQRRFGLNCYGCCEPVDPRWHVVKKTPNLRRVSISPWANQEKMAAALADRCIYSRKPAPSLLAVPRLEEELVRKDLRQTLEITRGCVVELIMKDNHTLGGNPDNLVRWVQIAREEIDRAYG
jgi:hypothetical protein